MAAGSSMKQALEGLDLIAKGQKRMIEGQHLLLEQMVENGLRTTAATIDRLGGYRLVESEKVKWTAVNQYTKESVELTLPKLYVGDAWLGQVKRGDQKSLVVDEVQAQLGGTATIFQRVNEQGDMLRVCTNVLGKDGTKAIGSFIPANNPDGKANPVVRSLLEGKTFHGRAFVVDRMFITAYEPVQDADGRVIGASYFGVPLESVDSVRKSILETQVGKSGYSFVLDSAGNALFSRNANYDQKRLWDVLDANGRPYIQEIIHGAMSTPDGQHYLHKFPLRDQEGVVRQRVVGCVYFEPWDWVLCVSCNEDEFTQVATSLREDAARSIWILLCVVSLCGALAVLATLLMSRGITKPLQHAVELADKVAAGELDDRLNIDRKDEIGRLGSALDRMADGLQAHATVATGIADGDLTLDPVACSERDQFGNALVGMVAQLRLLVQDIRMAAHLVETGSGEISSSSGTLSQGATDQAATLEEIGSSLTEASKQATCNAEQASEAGDLSRQAREAADQGLNRMESLTTAMERIITSSQSISKCINVIDDIAFQTNLLALNAAVEAARAGSHGKGFTVVAEEVRALAGRSAKAAKETSNLIRESLEHIRQGETFVGSTSESLRTIAERVGKTEKFVAQIAEASNTGARGLAEITTALTLIDSVTQKNAASSEETASASTELASQAKILTKMIARFRLQTD